MNNNTKTDASFWDNLPEFIDIPADEPDDYIRKHIDFATIAELALAMEAKTQLARAIMEEALAMGTLREKLLSEANGDEEMLVGQALDEEGFETT